MPKRRTSCLTLILLFTLAGACLTLLLLAGVLIPATQQAERAFGAPAKTLDPFPRVRHTAQLVL
jgi:hypothetical protein